MTDAPALKGGSFEPPSHFTFAELAREAEREVALRTNVYRNRVRDGKMREEAATRQIAMMKAIARHLQAEAKREDERLV